MFAEWEKQVGWLWPNYFIDLPGTRTFVQFGLLHTLPAEWAPTNWVAMRCGSMGVDEGVVGPEGSQLDDHANEPH